MQFKKILKDEKMDTDKSTNPFIFAFILTLLVSMLLSLTATLLNDKIEENIEVDKKKNIIKVIGLYKQDMLPEDIVNTYKKSIIEVVIDSVGNERSDVKLEKLIIEEDKSEGSFIYTYNNESFYPLYKSNDAIIVPISGKGLWSTLYGYFAIDIDMETVKGITFYKHGETPGLGAEVEKPWFQKNFKGKKIFNEDDELVSIKVYKSSSGDDIHGVDGISGATVTSDGVTNFLKSTLSNYKPYFDRNRQ